METVQTTEQTSWCDTGRVADLVLREGHSLGEALKILYPHIVFTEDMVRYAAITLVAFHNIDENRLRLQDEHLTLPPPTQFGHSRLFYFRTATMKVAERMVVMDAGLVAPGVRSNIEPGGVRPGTTVELHKINLFSRHGLASSYPTGLVVGAGGRLILEDPLMMGELMLTTPATLSGLLTVELHMEPEDVESYYRAATDSKTDAAPWDFELHFHTTYKAAKES